MVIDGNRETSGEELKVDIPPYWTTNRDDAVYIEEISSMYTASSLFVVQYGGMSIFNSSPLVSLFPSITISSMYTVSSLFVVQYGGMSTFNSSPLVFLFPSITISSMYTGLFVVQYGGMSTFNSSPLGMMQYTLKKW